MGKKRKSSSDDVVVLDTTEGTGAVVFWSFHGPTDYVELAMAWEDQDLPERELMNPTTPAGALRAADSDTRKYLPRGYFVRSIDKLTFIVVKESTTDADDDSVFHEEYEPSAKIGVTLRDDGPPKAWVKWAKGTNKKDNELRDYADRFLARYQTAIDEVSLHGMDIWIRRMMEGFVHVVALGERGKPFYVAPSKMDVWERVKTAITTANPRHVFRQIPAMKSQDCIDAVLDACMREVETQTDLIYEELDSDALGSRALKTRLGNLDSLLSKMESFESVLGPKVEDLRTSIADCRVAVTLAAASEMEDSSEAV